MEITKDSDIHKNQVFGLSGNGVDYFFYFISPLFNLTRSGFAINKNKVSLLSSAAKETKIPILNIHFCMHLVVIPYFLLISIPCFLRTLHQIKPEVIHCRNLISAFLAVVTRKLFHKKYKVVCDPRSVYVEEAVIKKIFRLNSITFKKWKKIERWIYRNSDACIGLSDFFTDYLLESNPNSFYVPALVKNDMVFDIELRKEYRKEFGLNDKDIVLTYVGSIGSWHSVEALLDCIKECEKQKPANSHVKFVFLTGNKSAIETVQNSLDSSNILKMGRVPTTEVGKYLHVADYGIVPGTYNNGPCYDLLYKTMISSKAEEFLASGLPVLVNRRIWPLAKMVIDNNAGVVYGDNSPIDLSTCYDRAQISKYFGQIFSAKTIVDSYKSIYESVLKANE